MPLAYLLDLDGTLIDSEPWYKSVEARVLREFGVPMTPEKMEEYTGLVLGDWLARVEQEFGVDVPIDEYLLAYAPAMLGHVEADILAFPDAERLVARIEGPCALVTSSMRWYVEAVLDRFPWIGIAVETVVTANDVAQGKPSPTPYLVAAEAIGVAPAACVVVEDSPNGVASGVAAGCHVVGVDRHGYGRLDRAHEVVRSLDSLAALVG